VLKNKCLPLFFVVSVETAKDTWEKLRQCFLNALNWRRNKKRGDGAKKKKIVPWRFNLEMSFLLPSLDTKILRATYRKKRIWKTYKLMNRRRTSQK